MPDVPASDERAPELHTDAPRTDSGHGPRLPRLYHARNVNHLHDEPLSLGQRLADAVARTIGSWRFIIIQSGLLVVWITLNVVGFVRHWDPYPFILLNLALSFQAAYAAPIIMMSQNRQAAKDRLLADNDFRTNVQAEHEIAALQAWLVALTPERWEALCAAEEQRALLREIRATLPGAAGNQGRRP